MTRLAFLAQLSAMKRGDQITYHAGNLMYDRVLGTMFQQVHSLASAAWEAYLDGRVTLVQKRTGPGEFAYIAVKL